MWCLLLLVPIVVLRSLYVAVRDDSWCVCVFSVVAACCGCAGCFVYVWLCRCVLVCGVACRCVLLCVLMLSVVVCCGVMLFVVVRR